MLTSTQRFSKGMSSAKKASGKTKSMPSAAGSGTAALRRMPAKVLAFQAAKRLSAVPMKKG